MRIRPIVWTTSMLIFAVAFCILQINTGVKKSPLAETRGVEDYSSVATEKRRIQHEKFQEAWRDARDHNYKAKLNNGTKRGGLTVEQLPKALQEESRKLATEYSKEIYPVLKKFVADNGTLPTGAPPGLEKYEVDIQGQYNKTGPQMSGRGSWAMGIGLRLDGTMVARDTYSKDPPDAPHDVWANFNKFANFPDTGRGFIITGWDDGRVTFDPVEQNYYATRMVFGEERGGAAIPGSAGIPPTAKHGLPWTPKKSEEAKPKEAKPE